MRRWRCVLHLHVGPDDVDARHEPRVLQIGCLTQQRVGRLLLCAGHFDAALGSDCLEIQIDGDLRHEFARGSDRPAPPHAPPQTPPRIRAAPAGRRAPATGAQRASNTLKGPTMGSGAGKPKASRLRTWRRSLTEPVTFGSRSASARQRAPWAARARFFLQEQAEVVVQKARATALLQRQRHAARAGLPCGTLPPNGLGRPRGRVGASAARREAERNEGRRWRANGRVCYPRAGPRPVRMGIRSGSRRRAGSLPREPGAGAGATNPRLMSKTACAVAAGSTVRTSPRRRPFHRPPGAGAPADRGAASAGAGSLGEGDRVGRTWRYTSGRSPGDAGRTRGGGHERADRRSRRVGSVRRARSGARLGHAGLVHSIISRPLGGGAHETVPLATLAALAIASIVAASNPCSPNTRHAARMSERLLELGDDVFLGGRREGG